MSFMALGHLGIVAYAYEPQRRAALLRALQSLAAVAPWPAGSVLALVRRTGLPPFAGAVAVAGELRVIELEDDGKRWEFGAWQRGVERVNAATTAPAGWLLLNDTAGVNDPWPRAERGALRQAAQAMCGDTAAVLAGRLRPAPAAAALDGQMLPGWVQTHAFALSAAALRALGGTVFDAALFAAPRVREGRIELPASLSPTLAAHISGWLTRPGADGWRAHSGRREVPDAVLRDKAGAILLEKRLAAGVLAAGGTLRDCGHAAPGGIDALSRRLFYWQRRLVQALPSRRSA